VRVATICPADWSHVPATFSTPVNSIRECRNVGERRSGRHAPLGYQVFRGSRERIPGSHGRQQPALLKRLSTDGECAESDSRTREVSEPMPLDRPQPESNTWSTELASS
jgi:hypothetical protein